MLRRGIDEIKILFRSFGLCCAHRRARRRSNRNRHRQITVKAALLQSVFIMMMAGARALTTMEPDAFRRRCWSPPACQQRPSADIYAFPCLARAISMARYSSSAKSRATYACRRRHGALPCGADVSANLIERDRRAAGHSASHFGILFKSV